MGYQMSISSSFSVHSNWVHIKQIVHFMFVTSWCKQSHWKSSRMSYPYPFLDSSSSSWNFFSFLDKTQTSFLWNVPTEVLKVKRAYLTPTNKPQTMGSTGHFRVPLGLCFKTRVGAQPLIWKSFFILMQIKLIFTWKVVHLASFRKWGFLELESGLLTPTPSPWLIFFIFLVL